MEFTDEIDSMDESDIFEYRCKYFKEELDAFKKYFDENVFYFECYRNFIYIYYKYSGFSKKNVNENSECLKIRIDTLNNKIVLMNLKYQTPNICKISGVELLYLLYKVAKELKMNILIETDVSYKNYVLERNPKIKCNISLDKYYILLKGISWYGLYGYFTESHKKETKINENVRNMSIIEYFDNDKKKVDEVVNYINQNNPYETRVTFETPIKDLMNVIDNMKRNFEKDNIIYCDNPLLKIIIDIIIQKKIIYDDEDLELDINDPNTEVIYNKLSEKLNITKTTTGGKKNKHKKKRKTVRKQLKKRHYRKKTYKNIKN